MDRVDEKQEYRYEIGGRVYLQRPLVLGQLRQLVNRVMRDLILPEELSAASLVIALGDRLPIGLAIVLTEEGTKAKDKDIDSFAEEIEFDISPELAFEVVRDFFDCNPISSLLEKLTSTMVGLQKSLGPVVETTTGSPTLLSSSPQEVS